MPVCENFDHRQTCHHRLRLFHLHLYSYFFLGIYLLCLDRRLMSYKLCTKS